MKDSDNFYIEKKEKSGNNTIMIIVIISLIIVIGLLIYFLFIKNNNVDDNQDNSNQTVIVDKIEFIKKVSGSSGDIYLDKKGNVYLTLSALIEDNSSLRQLVKEYDVVKNNVYNDDKIEAILLNISGVKEIEYVTNNLTSLDKTKEYNYFSLKKDVDSEYILIDEMIASDAIISINKYVELSKEENDEQDNTKDDNNDDNTSGNDSNNVDNNNNTSGNDSNNVDNNNNTSGNDSNNVDNTNNTSSNNGNNVNNTNNTSSNNNGANNTNAGGKKVVITSEDVNRIMDDARSRSGQGSSNNASTGSDGSVIINMNPGQGRTSTPKNEETSKEDKPTQGSTSTPSSNGNASTGSNNSGTSNDTSIIITDLKTGETISSNSEEGKQILDRFNNDKERGLIPSNDELQSSLESALEGIELPTNNSKK